MNKKILTLNTHSHIENNYYDKLNTFVSVIEKEKPDIFSLQEVNQSICESFVVPDKYFVGTSKEKLIKKDNHAYSVSNMLKEKGIRYYWTYVLIKSAYDKYEEGLAVFSKEKILQTKAILLSQKDDYNDWRTRKALGIKVGDIWYYNVHFGWWKNGEFLHQWNVFLKNINISDEVWIMGDFNNSSNVKNEGYEAVKKSLFYDTFDLAKIKDDGFTAKSCIDGWNGSGERIRIDYIFCNKKLYVSESKVIFNGKNYDVVSDHYGVIIKT